IFEEVCPIVYFSSDAIWSLPVGSELALVGAFGVSP
ncbi:hypothetical protein A2U01_0067709, partial [Trifolium medium]|nr:hypothetical protein [Trifolium medium]